MPPVIIAAIADAVAVAFEYSAIAYAITEAVAGAVIYAGISYGLGAAIQAIAGKPNISQNVRDRMQLIRASVTARRLLYGRVRTSGTMVACFSTDTISVPSGQPSTSNGYLHMVIALVGHECDAIETIFLGEVPLVEDPTVFDTTPQWVSTTNYSFNDVVFDSATNKLYKRTNVIFTGSSSVPYPPLDDTNCWTVVGDGKYFVKTYNPSTWVDSGGGDGPCMVEVPADPPYTWTSLVKVNKHLGSISQAADSDLIANCPNYWTSNHRLRGITYLYVMLTYDPAVWNTGIPNISAVVRGKTDIYDPRTATTGYSTNWALCVNNYITSSQGLNCNYATEIDEALLIAAANVSDEQLEITTAANLATTTHQNRYTCNGTIDTSHKPMDILTSMMTAGAGSVIWSAGLHNIFAGAYETPSYSLSENDLRASLKVSPRVSKKDLYNTITGTYVDPNQFWQATSFTKQTGDVWKTQDGGELARNVEMPFTTDPYEAQRTALLMLRRSRLGITVDFPAKFTAVPIKTNAVVYLSIAQLGWTNKIFRVLTWKLAGDGQGVDLQLQEESSDSYTASQSDLSYASTAPHTSLPSPWIVNAPTSLTLTPSTYTYNADTSLREDLSVDWQYTGNANTRFQLQYRLVTFAGWSPILDCIDQNYVIQALDAGTYEIRVRAVNSIGATSDWVSGSVTVNIPSTGVNDVTGFSASFANNQVTLTWNTESLNYLSYDIHVESSWTTGNIVVTGLKQGSYVFRPSGHGTFTYLIKAKNSVGNYSVTAASASVTVPVADVPTAIVPISQFLEIDLDITFDTTRQDTLQVEIWAATTNNRASASQVGISKEKRWKHRGLSNGAIWYYWARIDTVFGETGAWYPTGSTSGVMGSALNDPSAMIKLLDANVSAPSLAAYLAGTIPMIQMFDVGSMAATPAAAGTTAVATILQGLTRASSTVLQQGSVVESVATTVATHTGSLAALNAAVSGLITNNWSSGTAYVVGQYVRYTDGIVYQCIVNSPAGTLPTNTVYWQPASTMLTLLATVQNNIDTLTGQVSSKVSTTTYNTEVGNLVAATSAVDQRATVIDSKLKATTVAFLGGEEFDPTRRYSSGDTVVVTNITTKATIQYNCILTLPNPPTGTYPASDGTHWSAVASTGRLVSAESNITQNSDSITLSNQTIVGPLACLASAANNTASIFTIADLPPLNARISKTTITADSAHADILLQTSRVDALTGRVSQAEIDIDGANASVLLKASVTSVVSAQSTADGAAGAAATAISNAATAQSTANTATTNAATAQAKANSAWVYADANAADITIHSESIVGPLAALATAADHTSSIFTVADIPPGINSRVSQATIKADGANAEIVLQAGRTDALTGRVSAAEIAIDGANAEINLRVTKADAAAQLILTTEAIGLKLDATGTVGPGMAIGWTDGTHTRSNITLLTDTFRIAKPDGTGDKTIFSVGTVGGVSAVGISGDLFIDGSVSARTLVADSAMVTFLNARNITAGSVAAENITGTVITGKTLQTAASGERFVVSVSDNLAHFFGDRGDGTIEEIATIGAATSGGDRRGVYAQISYGPKSTNSSPYLYGAIEGKNTASRTGAIAILGTSNALPAIGGFGQSGAGVLATSATGYSVDATCGINWGVLGADNKAPIRLGPSLSASAPTHSADVGALWVTSTGVLYINNSGTTSWVKVASQ